ncbi:aminotransferase class IV [Halorarum salinum]|uniref:Aminotransferase class IV n=1 Tax=Halorarum salinum TaxID=2743089 RepID=A0A7D5L8R0_9EURY|nr:aminotransferase class IV [Halobaculum salinum]QLG60714.1 aminotransferase class IV [Halobaculum salinum]
MTDALRYHVDGDLVPADEASVSVRDRGFRYGDAGFETMRAYGGTVFRWDAHVERLFDTLEALGMPAEDLGLSAIDLRARVRDTLAANDLGDAYVRLSVTRGVDAGFAPPAAADTDPTVVVVVKPLARGGRADRGGKPGWDEPATVQTVKTRRIPDRSLPSDAKTHNYLNNVLARIETRVTDADAALMLDADGAVAECATANVFFVADDAIRTPSLDGPVLPGVTRAEVLDVAAGEGFPVEEGTYAPDDVRRADEAFLTSSVREIRPVATVDGVEIGGGPVTSLLSRLYADRVERECYGDVEGERERGGDGTDREGEDPAAD